MNDQALKTLANNGIDTLMVFFKNNPNHPSKAKFYAALAKGDMTAAFSIFQSFLVTLEKTCPEGVSVDYILDFYANK